MAKLIVVTTTFIRDVHAGQFDLLQIERSSQMDDLKSLEAVSLHPPAVVVDGMWLLKC